MADDAQQIAKHSAAEIQRLSTLSQASLPVISGQTLYEALEAYAKFALLKNSKAHGEHEATCARRLKKSHPDIQLSAFGISAIGSYRRLLAGSSARKKYRETRGAIHGD